MQMRSETEGKETQTKSFCSIQCRVVLKLILVFCTPALLLPCSASATEQDSDLGLWSKGEPKLDTQTLFTETDADHQGVRNPRIVTTKKGTVLAFGAGRLRRSEDGGKTWEPAVRSEISHRQVVNETSDDILAVSLRQGQLWRSSDDGKTWKKEEITIKPNAAMRSAGEAGKVPGSVHVGGCESGVTITRGDGGLYGRLLMPARYQPFGSNDREYWKDNYNTSVYSDDGGKTWQVSEFFPEAWTGEGTLAELSDGRVYYNSRTHNPDTNQRRSAWSFDSGETWTKLDVIEELFDGGGYGRGYGCNAGLVRLPIKNQDVLLYSQPDTQGGDRLRMTVWASFDGGKSWPVKRLVYDGPSAYSSLAAGRAETPSEGKIYLLFEGGPDGRYSAIQVASFNLPWLLDGRSMEEMLAGT